MAIELKGIDKRFGTVHANRCVSLAIRDGEVLALLGENGAGKSTLMKILYGFEAPDGGEIVVDGVPLRFDSPRAAMARGIGMVFQQFSLIPALTVSENLQLAYPKAPWWQGGRRAVGAALRQLAVLAPDIDPRALVGDLSVAEQQQVELVKVLNLEARLVILDEPTSVLTPDEAERLWLLVRKLAADGRAVVLITHKLEDVEACADRVAVMRAGELVETLEDRPFTEARLVPLMMGRESAAAAVRVQVPVGPPSRLLIKGLSATRQRTRIEDIDIELAGGEILGIAGVAGNGQSLLADCITGFAPLQAGEVILDGETVQTVFKSCAHDERIGYIPEHPARNAVAGDLSNCINLLLREFGTLGFFPAWPAHQASARTLMSRFDVRPPLPLLPSGRLSGGNLQKLVSARELSRPRKLVVACYPTMGLDVQAAAAVYAALFEQAAQGAGVVWISEDLDDLIRYAHRIAVLSHGRLLANSPASAADRHILGRWMIGAKAAA
jgi:ABC-type uncharacterized transport system ATPase subunit